MARWHARFELGDEHMTVETEAPTKDEALAIVERQNERMAAALNRPLYLLRRLRQIDPEPRRRLWRIGDRHGA